MSAGITLAEQIKCVERELAMRKRFYKKAVDQGRLELVEAEYEIEAMEAILNTLRGVKEPNLL